MLTHPTIDTTLKPDTPSTPLPSESFEQRSEALEALRADSERSALAVFAHRLAELKMAHPPFGHVDFWLGHKPYFAIQASPGGLDDFPSTALPTHSESLELFLARFAPDSFAILAQTRPRAEGPDAASFARQMGRSDVAALIEETSLHAAARQGARPPKRKTL